MRRRPAQSAFGRVRSKGQSTIAARALSDRSLALSVARHKAMFFSENDATGTRPVAAEMADGGGVWIEKRPGPSDPLVHELSAVNQDEGVGSAGGQQRCRNDRLAERGRRRRHAGVMLAQRIGGRRLLRRQFHSRRRPSRTKPRAVSGRAQAMTLCTAWRA